MKAIVSIFIFTSFFSYLNAKTNVHTIVEKLEKKYKSFTTLEVPFEQTITNKAYGKGITYTGALYLKKKGKMFWDYTSPKFDIKQIRSNGKKLCMYFPTEKEMTVEDNFDRLKETSGISFLWGEGNLEEQFSVTLQEETKNNYLLHFIPKDKEFEIDSMKVHIEKKSNLITELVTLDKGQNENRIIFTKKPRINKNMSDSLFSCTVGKGVTIRNKNKDIADETKNTPDKSGLQKKSD